MKRIQSKKHKLGTYEINKISLSYSDNKRHVLDNGIHTLAYFHKDIANKENENENENDDDDDELNDHDKSNER